MPYTESKAPIERTGRGCGAINYNRNTLNKKAIQVAHVLDLSPLNSMIDLPQF